MERSTVEETNDDAALSKLSAVTQGYYEDPFISLFVRGTRTRRSPLINRGYFARVAARDAVIRSFLHQIPNADSAAQILSLGAGSDTTFFRLCAANTAPKLFVEVDLEDVVRRKLKILGASEDLLDLAQLGAEEVKQSLDSGDLLVKSERYALARADLRRTEALDEVMMQKCGLDPALPTLVLSECVLVYLEPAESGSVIEWVSSRLKRAAFFVYEQIRPDDAFGKVMLSNLARRGCPLKGIQAHKSTEEQVERFRSRGFHKVECLDMNDVYYKVLDPAKRAAAEKLELFDEFEEWHLVQAHYCIVLALRFEEAEGDAGECDTALASLSLLPAST